MLIGGGGRVDMRGGWWMLKGVGSRVKQDGEVGGGSQMQPSPIEK